MEKANFFPLATFLVHCIMACITMAITNISTDQSSLLTLKKHLSLNPSHILSNNWSDSTSVCTWIGVTCGIGPQRVTALDISNMDLTGNMPPHLGNLSFLVSINLSRNHFYGGLPQELIQLQKLRITDFRFNSFSGQIPSGLGFLSKLQVLYLRDNTFTGFIPPLFNISNLQILDLSMNELSGEIPSSLSKCSKLQVLSLSSNKLSGSLPQGLGNLTMLRTLFLAYNKLTGVIPQVIGNLYKLEELGLYNNKFTGSLPPRIFNISTMIKIAISNNQLSGNLDGWILGCELPHLKELHFDGNNFQGRIPSSISNSSKLTIINFSNNNFTGAIPNFLGDLRFLEVINLQINNFVSESTELSFITSFTNCRYLTKLFLAHNPLHGILPSSIGNLSTSLQYIWGYSCDLHGSIPSEIGNLTSLILLDLWENKLTGSIPTSMEKLQKLQVLALFENKISGSIPSALCELHNLYALVLSENLITGAIPDCLGNITTLRYVHIENNRLTSSIPTSLWLQNNLLGLKLFSNFLSGSLPKEIGNLKAATYIDLSVNHFSGSIPTTIGDLPALVSLSLAHNRLQGSIPESMGKLVNLEQLDLSYNKLSGNIPMSLENLRYLTKLNVSFNDLSGEVPSGGHFRNFSSESFLSNDGLCGDPIYGLPQCRSVGDSRQKRRKLIFGVLSAILGIKIGIALAYVVVRYRKKKMVDVIEDSTLGGTLRISFFELMKATEGYNEGRLLGSGSFGSVYRATLKNGRDVAVKVFNSRLQNAFKSFHVECEVLRNLRHRNLCKVISTCSNSNFKALVLEYMPNGSLEKWLYSECCFLDILQRLNIMIDVACALEYLHYGNSMRIVHCDLKPSNVLLDEQMVAHLSDFGIAKIVGEEENNPHTTMLGTLGYIAPEYGLEGLASIRCDVYSYGIMLMEVFTRTKPNNERFSGDASLRSWINDSMPNAIAQVIDSNLLRPKEQYPNKLECVLCIMELALNCSVESANERVSMKDVVVALKKFKYELLA